MVYTGEDNQLAVARESTFKTRPSTVAEQPGGAVSDGVDMTEEISKERLPAMGTDRNHWMLVDNAENYEVSFPTHMQTAELLEFVMGGLSQNTTSATSAPYTHEITEAKTLPSMTVEHVNYDQEGSDDLVRTFLGCTADEATISSSEDDATVSIEVTFQSAAVDYTNTPDSSSLLTQKPFQHDDLASCNFDTSQDGGSAQEMPQVDSVEIEIANNVEDLPENTSLEDAEHVPLTREYDVSITFYPDSTKVHEDWRESREGDLTVEYQRDGNANDMVRFEFSEVEITEPGYSAPLGDVAEAEASFVPRSLLVTVKNDSSTYGIGN